jgi:hypothetical protein
MHYAVSILCVLVFFMLAGAFPAKGGGQLAVFRTPVFVLTAAALCAGLLHCTLRPSRLKRIGFVLCHLGVAAILGGAFIGFLFGRKTQFAAPIAMEHGISQIPGPDETRFELPFALSVTDFSVDFYDPDYHLYAAPSAGGDYVFEQTVTVPPSGELDLGRSDRVVRDDLLDGSGQWVRQHVLPSGRLLQMADPVPRHYEATLKLSFDTAPSRTETLAVNHPVSRAGWRFYLMSYDQEARRYIVLSARRDPGRRLVIAGMWALIAGTAWLCWLPRRRRAAPAAAPGAVDEETPHGPG